MTYASTSVRGAWRRRIRSRLCLVPVASVLVLGVMLPAQSALALPEGRHYEMVSPLYKGGYGIREIDAVAQNGDSVAYFSVGVFAGAPGPATLASYIARRGAAEWATASVMPPAELGPEVHNFDFSSTLESTLALTRPGPNNGWSRVEADEQDFLLHQTTLPDTPTNWELAGVPIVGMTKERGLTATYQGASSGFCHILLNTVPLLPGASLGGELYDDTQPCGGGPSLRPVGMYDEGSKAIDATCPVVAGSAYPYTSTLGGASESMFNAVSSDGSEIFFMTNVHPPPAGGCPGEGQLFVSLGGVKDIEVSKPLSQPCGEELPCSGAATRAPAHFQGANEAGSVVYFTSSASLAPSDEDVSNDLYMARIGCPGEPTCEPGQREVISLTQASRSVVAGEAAEVQGVVEIAPDGSRVYFVARGVLSEAASSQGQLPGKGADNLYVYDAGTGKSTFIAELCSGPEQSGEAEDLNCPNNLSAGRNDTELWLGDPQAQTAGPSGEFLVFASYGQLTADDVDSAKDIYRYDAGTGVLERVSIGEMGADRNGNNSVFDAHIAPGHRGGGHIVFQHEMDNRAISEDGSRIVFTTAEPLSPAAVNHLVNVYEWHKEPGWVTGRVGLVSGGGAEANDEDPVISPSGRDVFFLTTAGLANQDTDGLRDLYDARLGAGFPPVPSAEEQCEGDGCHGPLTNPAPLLVPGSVSQAPGEDAAQQPVKPAGAAPKSTVKKSKKKRASAKRRRRRGKASRRPVSAGRAAERSGR